MFYKAFYPQKVVAYLKLLPRVALEVMWHFNPSLVGIEKGYEKDERLTVGIIDHSTNTITGAF